MEEVWAQIISFGALLWIVISYFVSKKNYLLFQAFGMVFLMLSYLLKNNYFAMVGIGLGLLRALIFYIYELNGKEASIALSFIFAILVVASYFIVNIGIQKIGKYQDILYVVSLVFYAFTFRLRDKKILLYTTLIPTSLAFIYNLICYSTLFVVLTYAFELFANVVAIFKFYYDKNKKIITKGKHKTAR